MLRNYLVTAFRNMRRHPAYSVINIAGLAIGLACSFFIVLWVQDEMSFNTHLEEGDQIFRVMRHAEFGGEILTTDSMPMPMEAVLRDDYPEVTHTVLGSWENEMVLAHEEVAFRVAARHFGKDFFTVFRPPILAGDGAGALLDPESVAISESLAERFFGPDWRIRKDLLGTTFRLDNRLDVKLTAVYEDPPATSSLRMEAVLPIEEFVRRNEWLDQWGNNSLRIFARLDVLADPAVLEAKIRGLIDEHVEQWKTDVFLQPVADWYLRSRYEGGVQTGGRIRYVRIFILVAVFILLIAAINFMNLATARSSQRAREIGVRKSLGATRDLLARQFISEAVLTAMLAFGLALLLVLIFLPSFNDITDKSVALSLLDPALLFQFAALTLATGVLAGSYPAFYLSSLTVVGALKSSSGGKARGGGLRRGLVVFQFSMSIVLIVGTITIYRQLGYIQAKDLGVNRENVVFLDFEGGISDQYETFRNELLSRPGIVQATASDANPLSLGSNTISVQWAGKSDDDNTLFSPIHADYDFVEAMGIELVEGRLFSEDFGADSSNYVINERAAIAMGMVEPVGQPLTFWDTEGTIVGVVKDFHMRSLYRSIEPVVIRLRPERADRLFVRTAAGQTREALASLEAVYRKFNPEYPFDYRFMDEEFESVYRSEAVVGTLANIFAVLAILIACLGLFGLASFTAEQRSKEIGIRKVMGASVTSVVTLLSREFILLVVAAFALAAPIAYWVMTRWLNDFEFHTDLGLGILLGAGVASVVIAWLTVSYQSYRAAAANPVTSLRSD